jgi:putative flippase GtrA
VTTTFARYRATALTMAGEFAKFGVVGAVCTVIDIGLFNAFHFGLGIDPLLAKTLSLLVAVTVSYLANRHWSFRHRSYTGYRREYVLFFVINAVGLAFSLACLAVTKYGLDLTGPLALNIAGNVVGMGGGILFRFWAYRRWVFPAPVVAVDQTNLRTATQ